MTQEVTPEELIIKRGLAAQELLGNEAYALVVNALYNQSFESITSSALKDTEKRENAFFQLRALQDITTELKSWVHAKDSLFSQPAE
jgi:hypothetical protein